MEAVTLLPQGSFGSKRLQSAGSSCPGVPSDTAYLYVRRLSQPLPLHTMGKKSKKKAPTPLPLPCDHCAKRVAANVVRRCPKCELVVYCSKECQRAAWSGGHRGSAPTY